MFYNITKNHLQGLLKTYPKMYSTSCANTHQDVTNTLIFLFLGFSLKLCHLLTMSCDFKMFILKA